MSLKIVDKATEAALRKEIHDARVAHGSVKARWEKDRVKYELMERKLRATQDKLEIAQQNYRLLGETVAELRNHIKSLESAIQVHKDIKGS